MPLIEPSTSYVNDEIVAIFLAILRDEIYEFSQNTIVASGSYFIPRYLNINITRTSDLSSTEQATTDFEYLQNTDRMMYLNNDCLIKLVYF